MRKKNYIVTLLWITSMSHAISLQESPESLTEEIVVPLPADVTELINKSQECAYWVMQWDPALDDSSKEHVEQKVNSICLEIMDQRTQLMDKYSDHPEILDHLN